MEKRVPELMLPHVVMMEEIMFDLSLVALPRKAAKNMSAIIQAAKSLSVAVCYVHAHNQHGELQNYITIPETALTQLNEALAALEKVDEEEIFNE